MKTQTSKNIDTVRKIIKCTCVHERLIKIKCPRNLDQTFFFSEWKTVLFFLKKIAIFKILIICIFSWDVKKKRRYYDIF